MASIVDERGYNQSFKPSSTQSLRLKRRAEAMIAEMRLPASAKDRERIHILEIGCGPGEMAHQLAELTGARVTGVDLSRRFIEEAQTVYRHPLLNFAVVDLTQDIPPSEAGRYDYIVGNGILHHLYNHLDSFLPLLARRLKQDGRLIFWEPNFWNPYIFLIFSVGAFRRLAKLEPDEMAFTPPFISRKLDSADFQAVKAIPRDFLLPNTPARTVKLIIRLVDLLEKIPGFNRLAQSIFIVATKKAAPL